MKRFRILIVEDEALIAMDLEDAVAKLVSATFLIAGSVSAAKKILEDPVDLAFLDVNVTDGKTFELAYFLERKAVPFIIVSGFPQHDVPASLRGAPFIPKPFQRNDIERALQRCGFLPRHPA
jgi:two-component SAPR family response regulator